MGKYAGITIAKKAQKRADGKDMTLPKRAPKSMYDGQVTASKDLRGFPNLKGKLGV